MATKKDLEHARQQAQAQLESIKEMVAALECNYERLQELKDEREALTDDEELVKDLAEWDTQNSEELKELIKTAGECESREDAEQRIQEDPLEIQVRAGWYTPGEKPEKPSEFLILLCTGGPACRIVGELNEYGDPIRTRLEYQDWFTSWTEYITTGEDHKALLTYAQCFYFGE